MKIARFTISGRPAVAIDSGKGFIDYGAVLQARGFSAEMVGFDPERRIVRMLKRGLLDGEFIAEQLQWAKRLGMDVGLNTAGLTPLLTHRPVKIICVARNWGAHASESNEELPDRVVYFAKTDNCAIGTGEKIPLPIDVGRIDHEGELGVVISRRARRVSAAEAGRYILGYTAVNDVTAREMQRTLAGKGLPWYAAKAQDGFLPMGPWIVTPCEFEPYENKRILVTVNGDIRQDGMLDEMHWKVPQLIEAISAAVTLEPGDVIAAGTPPGVGELAGDDEVSVEIEGLGRLVSPVAEMKQ